MALCVCARSSQLLRTRLALCMSSVAVYALVAGEWEGCVQELTQSLGGADAAGSQMLCDVLGEVVEEVWEAQLPIGEEERLRVQGLLTQQLPFVQELLLFTLQAAQEHRPLQKSAFACLCSWWKNVQAAAAPAVLRHPCVDAAFGGLAVAELEEGAAACVLELIRLVEVFCHQRRTLLREDGETFDELDEDGEPSAISFSQPMAEEQTAAMRAVTDRVVALLPAYSQRRQQPTLLSSAAPSTAAVVRCADLHRCLSCASPRLCRGQRGRPPMGALPPAVSALRVPGRGLRAQHRRGQPWRP